MVPEQTCLIALWRLEVVGSFTILPCVKVKPETGVGGWVNKRFGFSGSDQELIHAEQVFCRWRAQGSTLLLLLQDSALQELSFAGQCWAVLVHAGLCWVLQGSTRVQTVQGSVRQCMQGSPGVAG